MDKLTLTSPKYLHQWLRLYRLYLSAFPAEERKPFFTIVSMFRKKRMDVWCLEQDRHFLGFVTAIDDEGLVLIDYLAIEDRCRGKGIGTAALQAIQKQYSRKQIFLEIESIYEQTPNLAQRQRRRAFYLRSGLKPMNVMINLFGVKMELLGFDCHIDYDRYHRFYMKNLGRWAAGHVHSEAHPHQNTK